MKYRNGSSKDRRRIREMHITIDLNFGYELSVPLIRGLN